MPQEQQCRTQQECADQTFKNQQASAEEQIMMNKQIGGSVAEITCAAGSTASDCAQQQRTTETRMQMKADSEYDHCLGVPAGSQAGCGKKKRKKRRKRKSRKSRKSRRRKSNKRRSKKNKRKTRRRRRRK